MIDMVSLPPCQDVIVKELAINREHRPYCPHQSI